MSNVNRTHTFQRTYTKRNFVQNENKTISRWNPILVHFNLEIRSLTQNG